MRVVTSSSLLFQAALERLEFLQDRALALDLFELSSLEHLALGLAFLQVDDRFELRYGLNQLSFHCTT